MYGPNREEYDFNTRSGGYGASQNAIGNREQGAIAEESMASTYRSEMPKISVVIITYNFAEYLRECIESVLAQTLLPWEIIICDDHSTDGSWDIIQEYSQQHPRLIKAYRHKQNMGPFYNGTFGAKAAGGDLVSFIDGDDRWLPRKLELEWKALEGYPEAQIAYSNVYTIDAAGNRTGIWYDGQGPTPPSGDVFIEVFSKRFFPNTRSVFRNELVRRFAFDEEGHCDEDLICHWDWDRKIRYTARFPVVYSGEALVEYRVHGKGIHNTLADKLFESAYAVYRKNLPLLASRSEEEAAYVKREVEGLLMWLLSRKLWGWEVASRQAQLPKTTRQARSLPARNYQVASRQAQLPKTTQQGGVVPPFLVNSLPKAGTNLLAKAMGLFPGIRRADLHLGQSTLTQLRELHGSREVTAPIGVDWPQPAPLSALRQSLQRLENGHYATAHIPFSEQLAALLAAMGLKMLLILRDPRDVVVSHAKFVARRPDHFLFELYRVLPESERIMKSITGVNPIAPGGPMLLNIRERCLSVLPWASQTFTYTTCFEKLVGPQGGGTREAQIEELENIAQHLGLPLQRREVEQIADQMFGGTHTFRKGATGDWRNHFSVEHKHVFKKLAGQLLIDLGYEQDFDW